MALIMKIIALLSVAIAVGCGVVSSSSNTDTVSLPEFPVAATETEVQKGMQTAVFAGGCFWGVEAVFESIKGVKNARSGYAGGDARSANYDDVSSGRTKHAEAVLVTFDPAKVTYAQLLNVFFSVVHDPTEVNRQGPDVGPQYRSAIFYTDETQKKTADAYIGVINESKVFEKPVATQVTPLTKFYDAEEYHQNYLVRNPTQPYIVIHDMPKLEALKAKFPDLYVAKK
ncbi:MAG: peptide-methionine (S)-S-oxide reductase MsrA [Pyrinomonadaceae bacterium]